MQEKVIHPGAQDATLLRIFVADARRYGGHPLYEAIVLRAREFGLAGATVLKSAMGYGMHSRIHTAKILQLSTDLPIVVEIVDEPGKIQAFLPVLEAMMDGGLATVETVQAIHYPTRE